MLTVEVRNASLTPVGMVDDFTSLRFTEIWMGVGGWVLDINPASAAVDELLKPGAGIVVRDGSTGRVVYSGPVGVGANDQPTAVRERGTDNDTLVVSGTDDMVHIANRVAHPSPTTGAIHVDAYDVRSGPASTVLLEYISANLGPDALPHRRLDNLTFAIDTYVGGTVTGRARWQNLLTFLTEIAYGAGVRIRQAGRTLVVTASAVRDLSADVIFSFEYGNLTSATYEQAPSAANAVYVAGQGEGAARAVVESSIGAVRRIETFVDRRDVAVSSELAFHADVALQEMVGAASLTVVPIETPELVYDVDYHLGDIVTVIVDGVPFADQIRSVETLVSTDGVDRSLTIGTTAPLGIHALFAQLRRMSRRVNQLERI